MGPKRRSKDKNSFLAQPTEISGRSAKLSSLSQIQSQLLAVFEGAFPHITAAGPEAVKASIQRLKQALYATALGSAFVCAEPGDLDAYAFRWSPTRALGYLDLFGSPEIRDIVRKVLLGEENVESGHSVSTQRIRECCKAVIVDQPDHFSFSGDKSHARQHADNSTKIVALGGGAGAELVALAGLLADVQEFQGLRIHLNILDIAPWQPVLQSLFASCSTRIHPERDGVSLVSQGVDSETLAFTFNQLDVLSLTEAEIASQLCGCKVVTIFFTLNELYAASKGKTTAFLLYLTNCLEKGAALLIVDSAGSYGTVQVGQSGAGREPSSCSNDSADRGNAPGTTYPMHFLLDHTLLDLASLAQDDGEQQRGRQRRRWSKVYEEKARWFRLPKHVPYPLVELENMRMQVHCYERI